MNARFELFDHTADIGLRIFAPTLPGLVAPASEAMYTVIGDLVAGGGDEAFSFDVSGAAPAVLLRDYLARLLLLFELDGRMVPQPRVIVFGDCRLAVEGNSCLVDEGKSVYHREVKAITYHELEISKIPGGYRATLIVDI